MLVQKLHNNWKLRQLGSGPWLQAKVPGSVYNDLLLNKKMEDPFWRDNEDKAIEPARQDDLSWNVIITIEKPDLWWPRGGYGAQPLYTVKVILLNKRRSDFCHGRQLYP